MKFFITAFILVMISLFVIPKELGILFYPIGAIAFVMMVYDLFCFASAINYQTEDQFKKEIQLKTDKRHIGMDENNKILKKYELMPDLEKNK